MVNCKVIQEHIENVICYLQPLLPLANFHMVDYFKKEAYRNLVPDDIQLEINNIKSEDVTSNILNNDYTQMPNLYKYMKNSEELALKNCQHVCLNTNQFQDRLVEWGCEKFLRLKLEIFMTYKKSHEVDIMSFLSAAIRDISKTSHIIDIGDGKGYLSSMLALHYKIPVLGVDASEINTNGAVQRVQKLSKVWNSVVNKHEIKKTKETTADLYKQITQFVNESTDFKELVENVFLEKPSELSLVGLHTCGNLAATSIRIFDASEQIKTICNVGCCYHHITEYFEVDPNRKDHALVSNGFPMSKYLREKRFVMGRAARMIAAQSVERVLHKKQLPNRTLFYRALFEVLIENKCVDVPANKRKVGRFRKECVDFADYVQKASRRINVDISASNGEIEDLFDEYKCRMSELNNFYLIRCMLAPVIESLILLDRLLFLHEQGHEKSFIVQLFDPVISPRCYGLIAIK
ncbi:methyltransferase-like protein 25 [Anoplophora glabripennis]|uniref:methyltransferase-like protein 25 n=1 Tax=Anoplophora glabripennis TaxID=217634 RepID=UPI0008749194|nr:methyltransferase-like protein 25 [Anoplophora glabripennis]